MLRTLRLISLIALLPVGGCVIGPHHHHPGSSRSFLTSGSGKSCPSGHVWSDGQCHSKGRGHDPAKKRGKH